MAAYGTAAAPVYGFQAAKNTTLYPPTGGVSVPVSRQSVAPQAPTANPAAAQTAKNTTGYSADQLVKPTTPLSQPTKTVSPNPPPTTPRPSSAPAPAPSTPALYDYTTDPVLQQVEAQSQAAEATAHAQAMAAQNQLAIQYSDPAMALDATNAAVAKGNPYGVFGALNAQEPLDQQALDETLNKDNLFYSGARINQQEQLANQYGQKRSDAAGAEQQAYSQIQATLLAAEQQAEAQVAQAQAQAYDTYIQELLAGQIPSGGGGGGGGDNSNPGGGAGSAGAPASNPGLTLLQYLGTPAGQNAVAQTTANPQSAGSSGAAGVLLGQTKKNYQAAARAA